MNNEIKGEFHITKLSDTNYQSWKTEMCWYLRGKNLLDYVLTEKRPDQNATENEVRAHRMNENKAFAAIGLHIEADQQIHIEDCANAHEAWETLKQVHQPKSRVRIMKLKKEFYHLRMKDEEGMSAYVSRVKVATRNLREAGAEVKDEDLAYAMLAGLPDSYENLNMALASLSDDKFTSAEVKRVLLEEYDRRISRLDRTTEHFKEALYVNKKTEKNESKPSGNNFKQLRTCFNCNKVGHIARDCRIRINKDKRKQETRYKRDNDAFLISLNNVDLENSWLLDSGCTHHVCKRREWFANFRHINSEVVNTAADPVKQKGITLKAQGIGNIRLNMIVGNRKKTVVLHDVYYVPNIRRNLMSVSQIEQKGKELLIKNGKVKIRNVITKNIVGEAYRKNDLYIVKTEVCTNTSFPVESHNASMEMNQLWHRRFCHVSNDTIKKLIETNRVTGLDNAKTNKYICDACNIAKATRVASKRLNIKQTKETCELIHSDVCGPMPEKSIGGSRYFITFTDDFSRYTTVVCIKSKDEVKRCIKEYIAKVEREKGKKVKRFRTDNGLEFCNQELNEFFKNLGIKHERSNVDTPQMNGVAERINRTLLELTRSSLKSAHLPKRFWAEAVTTAAYIKNRVCHTAINDKVPLAVWIERTPSVRHLKVYGCLAYARLPEQGRRKLNDRAVECIFVGYATQTRGYRLWYPQKDDIITTKHAKFAEDKVGYEWIREKNVHDWSYEGWSDDNESEDGITTHEREVSPPYRTPQGTPNQRYSQNESEEHPDSEIVGVQEPRQISRRGRSRKLIRNPYGRKGKPKNQEIGENEDENSTIESDIETNFLEIIEPETVEEALASPQARQWKNAIREELDSLSNRNTWEVTELPKGRKCIGCKWVFKLKTNTEGKITRYKARLVAQGFSQKKGVDYSETYSPVANFSLIRLFLALAVIFKWHTRHVDIKCAYLYGTLKEEIYMKLPPLYNAKEGMVAKLLRPIYGLKQSGRNWNEELDVYLTGQGFKRMQSSSCVYKREDGTILIIYVDDIFIFAPDSKLVTDTVRRITEKYEAKDLGEINQALGVKVERNNAGNIYLSQRLYIEEMLKKYNMTECRKVTTPLDPSLRISKEDAPTTDTERSYMANVPYRGLIGGLMFLALYTRPDILFAVTKLSQYNSNPGRKHWQQAKHILRYLSATKDYGIVYKTNIKPKFEIYCDADWACDPDDRHSFSGMVMLFGGNIVKWRTVKQKSLSTSTMEAEYVSLANGVKEAMWLNMFMSELGLTDYVSDSLQINCDNRAAIDFAKNRMEKNRTKHIDIAYHIVRENLEKGLIHLTYVPSNENLADGMTKGLKKIVHDRYVKNIGMGVTKWGN
ncbi:Retrovirus-related Pol polyprotein from transposon TNT 1-94 [Anthophora quadrimaculata]